MFKKKYMVTDRNGRITKVGMFTEAEVRMAAKAGMRIFELDSDGKHAMEITQELTGLFPNLNRKKPGEGSQQPKKK